MRIKCLLIFQLFILFLISCKQTDEQFAKKLITTFKENSIHKKDIDWSAFESKVMKSSKVSKNSAIITALTLNNERHTWFVSPNKTLHGIFSAPMVTDTCKLYGSLKIKALKDVGYFRINSIGQSNISANTYINEVLDSIKKLDKSNLKAWIIDLRYNTGGNMWPMLIALSPFLQEGVLGYFKFDTHHQRWEKKNDHILLDNTSINDFQHLKPISYTLKNKHIKIAVLVGKSTASSGEATAIVLRSLKSVRFFGLKTVGFTTGNRSISMGNNGTLIMTESIMQDDKGKMYPNGILPDFPTCTNDELLKTLTNWIDN